MDTTRLQTWWFAKQGLDRRWAGLSPREILAKAGWARSVGGANPYLTVYARSDHGRARLDADATSTEVHELPTARGCTYVLGKDDFPLGLRVGQGFSEEAAIQTAIRFLGVTEAEIALLCTEVLRVLEGKELDPKEIKEAVGPAARSLGEEGKKRGQSTTLPLALGRLQQCGQIRRVSVEGRFDRQRYRYARWQPSPLDGCSFTRDEALLILARRYFEWIGPATVANFQWFSGLGARAAKAIVDALGVVPIDPGSNLLILPEEKDAFEAFEVPEDPQIALLSALDSLFLLRRNVTDFIDVADLKRSFPDGKGVLKSAGSIVDLSTNVIVDRGRIVGLWEFDPEEGEVVATCFVPRSKAVEAAIQRTEAFIREELGDCRSFSLDSPESRQPLLKALRELSLTN